ncbi:MAG: SDR family oxidoreductase [Gemmatimonadota bacterium]
MSQPPNPTRYDLVRSELIASPKVWLVTGAAGFIGSNLVEELVALGQRVVGLDNFSTGHRANLDDVVAATAGASGVFSFVEGDIRDTAICRKAADGVDYVLHHAALASVPESLVDPLTSCQVNVDGFLNVMLAARDASAQRVVYASSSAVYGDAATVPQVEHDTGMVLSPYAASKAANELYAAAFQRSYGLETVGLRYYNIFGRRQDPEGAYAAVIPRWTAKLLSEQPCEVFGDGGASRDFCYVANVVQANVLAATAPDPVVTSQAYNIACGAETTLNELFYIIRDGLAAVHPVVANATPSYAPERLGDIRRSVADISKARHSLGYEPLRSTADGLREALHWYATQYLSSESLVTAPH